MTSLSRVVGRGRLMRTLRHLVRRVDRYGQHRATAPAERLWAHAVGDRLDEALRVGLADPGARASLEMADRRADISRKSR